MIVLNSVDSLLEHIREVQEDVIGLSNDSLLKMSSYIEKNQLEVDEDISTALQYQDIITQQLGATIEAIDSIKESINNFDSTSELENKLNTILAEAKDKKNRFSGKTAHDDGQDDEIEFF